MFFKEILLNNGSILVLREAKIEDAQAMIDHMQTVSAETDFLTYGEGEFVITLQEEKVFVEGIAKSDNQIFLLAEIDGKVIGISSVLASDKKRIKHIGNLGLSIQKDYWGLGIGSHVMQALIAWAKDTKIIKKIDLSVLTDNNPAIALYKKFGFEQEGLVRRNMYIDGTFFDSYMMGVLID